MVGLKARIVEKSSDLNPSDKKILNYLLNNAAECSELSLAKLAKKLYVSESAIFRLCKKVGLSGYSELKYELADFSKGEKRMVKIPSPSAWSRICAQSSAISGHWILKAFIRP